MPSRGTKYERRVAAGACLGCGRPRAETGSYCEDCVESRRQSQRRFYRKCRAEGRCVSCRKQLVPNWRYIRCLACKECYG